MRTQTKPPWEGQACTGLFFQDRILLLCCIQDRRGRDRTGAAVSGKLRHRAFSSLPRPG